MYSANCLTQLITHLIISKYKTALNYIVLFQVSIYKATCFGGWSPSPRWPSTAWHQHQSHIFQDYFIAYRNKPCTGPPEPGISSFHLHALLRWEQEQILDLQQHPHHRHHHHDHHNREHDLIESLNNVLQSSSLQLLPDPVRHIETSCLIISIIIVSYGFTQKEAAA